MSVKKDSEALPKVSDDDGFYSGPLSEINISEEIVDEPPKDSNTDNSTKVNQTDTTQLDSGLDLTLSEDLSNIQLSDRGTEIQGTQPLINITDEKNQDIPPLAVLFQQDDDGDTQLHIAAVHGCEKSVSTLVRVCPDKVWLDVPNDFGHTALHLAVLSGHAVLVRMLVIAGASISIRDLAGENPLHIASSSGDVACINALLNPVPEKPQIRSAVLNQKNYNGQTSAHLAAMAGHVEALKTLVFYGADINAREGLCGWTPLHVAAVRGHNNATEYLIGRCAGVYLEARDYAGRTPRRVAAEHVKHIFNSADVDLFSSDSEESEDDSDNNLFEELLAMQKMASVA